MNIAVIGGGIFGCTAAIYAARAGHEVHLYEKASRILSGASQGNQLRLHEGYHYPRSPATATECREGNVSFREEYGDAVDDSGRHLYAISSLGSKVGPEEYLRFCQSQDLPYTVTSAGEYLSPEMVDLVIEVPEGRIDPNMLRLLIDQKMQSSGVQVHIDTAFTPIMGWDYDKVIVAAYGNTNSALSGLPGYDQCRLDTFQFEVVEKPVVRMPSSFRGVGVVVMDGEFCCVDPIAGTGLHALGHVNISIWNTHIGLAAEVPYHLVPYMDKGVIQKPSHTRITEFIELGSEYIPAIAEAEYYGSMYTVRSVLPNKNATDERPTLVETLGKDMRYVRIFSGKIGTACQAAQDVVDNHL